MESAVAIARTQNTLVACCVVTLIFLYGVPVLLYICMWYMHIH